jgi:hypothetical protein
VELDPHSRQGVEVQYELACVHAAQAERQRRAEPGSQGWRVVLTRAGDAFLKAIEQGAFDIADSLPDDMGGPGHDPRLDILREDPRFAVHFDPQAPGGTPR